MNEEAMLPISISVQITDACNLRCTHCAVYDPHSAGEVWSDAMVHRFFNLLGSRTPILDLTGGEPVVAWHVLTLFGEEAAKRDILWGLTTNGLLLTDDHIEQLLLLNVYGVKVSLDGTRESHEEVRGPGTYDEALATIARLVDRGVRVGVQTAVSWKNEAHISRLIETLDALGVTTHILFPLLPLGRQAAYPQHILPAAELKRFILDLRQIPTRSMRIYCELPETASLVSGPSRNEDARCAVGYMLHFTARGDAFPCPAFPLVIGNIHDHTIDELVAHPALSDLRNRQGIHTPCASCVSFSQCGGGCRAMAWVVYRNLHAADPFCWEVEADGCP